MVRPEPSRETREFLASGCIEMICDIRRGADVIMKSYRKNPTQSDFYSTLLREAEIKILAIRELYRRLTGDDLE